MGEHSVAAPLCKDKGCPGGQVPAIVSLILLPALCQALFRTQGHRYDWDAAFQVLPDRWRRLQANRS